MKNTYLIVNVYNPFKPEAVVNAKGIATNFTKEQAEKYVREHHTHLTPLGIVTIRKDSR